LTNRGNIYLRSGLFDWAVADFQAALELDPTHVRARALLGQAYLHQGRLKDAVRELEQALVQNPGFYETLVLRAVANLSLGKTKDALADLDGVAKDPSTTSPRVRFARALSYHLRKQNDQALYELAVAIDDPALNPFAVIVRAQVWLSIGGRGHAIALEDAQALAKAVPNGAFAQWQAACIFAVASEKEAADAVALRALAMKSVRRAVELQPALVPTLVTDPGLKALAADPDFQKLSRQP
jgi:tetratricopeptide (TPR) repeat protein